MFIVERKSRKIGVDLVKVNNSNDLSTNLDKVFISIERHYNE